MKRLFLAFLLAAPCLHAEGSATFDLLVGRFNQFSTRDHVGFDGSTVGIGLRIPDPDRTGNVLRVTLERGFGTGGYSSQSVSDIRDVYSLAFDYVWHQARPFYIGAGVRVSSYKVVAPPNPGNVTVSYGTDHPGLPQIVLGWNLPHHFSLELDSSLIQNSVQLRYSF